MAALRFALLAVFALVSATAAKSTAREVSRLVALIDEYVERYGKYTPPDDNSEYLGPTGQPSDAPVEDVGTFDFVIVGAGPAGCVLADRLSASGKRRVLLLEAGEDENEFSRIPGLNGRLMSSPLVWRTLSVPQEHACFQAGKRCSALRGRAMGGSAAINSVTWVRGDPAMYRDLGALFGKHWDYDNVLKHYKALESLQRGPNDTRSLFDLDYHGKRGPMTVGLQQVTHPWYGPVVEALRGVGLQRVDYSGARHVGYSRQYKAIASFRIRQSPNRAFVEPARRRRRNLVVETGALATRLEFAPASGGGEAVVQGVEFVRRRDGRRYRARVHGEVVLSAGVYNSPKLLMLSGVGPKEHLDGLGIPVQLDLPVGDNLLEVPGIGVRFELTAAPAFVETRPLDQLVREYLRSRGPLSTPAQRVAAFLDVAHQRRIVNDTTAAPDPGCPAQHASLFPSALHEMIFFNLPWPAYPATSVPATVAVNGDLLRPQSRGRVRLASADWLDNPAVDMRLFERCEDRAAARTLLRVIRAIVADAPALAHLRPRVVVPEACAGLADEDARDACVVSWSSQPTYTAVGTCAMGSVTDAHGRVLGARNLRVADTSVLPFVYAVQGFALSTLVGSLTADAMAAQWKL